MNRAAAPTGMWPWAILLPRAPLAARLLGTRLGAATAFRRAAAGWSTGGAATRAAMVMPRSLDPMMRRDIAEVLADGNIEMVEAEDLGMVAATQEWASTVGAAGILAVSSAADVMLTKDVVDWALTQAERTGDDVTCIRSASRGLSPVVIRTHLLSRVPETQLLDDAWTSDRLRAILALDRTLRCVTVDSPTRFGRTGGREDVRAASVRVDLSTDRGARALSAATQGLDGSGPLHTQDALAGVERVQARELTRLFRTMALRARAPARAGRGSTVACFTARAHVAYGGDVGMSNLLRGLAERGRGAVLFTGTVDGSVVQVAHEHGVTVCRQQVWNTTTHPPRLRDMLADVMHSVRVLAPHRVGLVYANTTAAGALPALVALMLGVPYVARVVEKLQREAFEESLVMFADRVVIPSAYLENHCRCLGVPADRLRVVPEGIGDEWLAAHSDNAATLRSRLGVDPTTHLLATVGRVDDPDKRMDLAVRTTADLLERGRDVHLAVCGGAVPGSKVVKLAGMLGIGRRVTFLGHIRDVRSVLHACDLLLHTARTETFGLVLTEAMACQVPPVAVRTGGIPEQVMHGITGVLVDDPDPAVLAGEVQRLLDDRVLRARMGKAGHAHVAANFTAGLFAQRMAELFEETGGPSPVRGGGIGTR